MANEEVVVGLRFTADTQQAAQALSKLKTELTKLSDPKTMDFSSKLTTDLVSAQSAARQLKTMLEQATNVNTGNLNLKDFASGLKTSGMTLQDFRTKLTALGPEGSAAFMKLASSISHAETPLLKLNKISATLWDSLKRTAGWQISSTAIHAFMGAIQGAYHYAQDLNSSLNNIRIVTGQSVDQMAAFADRANKAAKALSTTTTAYTDAALIYYQQGLSDSQVQERTDVTIKMANVSRQSAQEVSDQMTAVWNNFDDGSVALETYADKMVALGAATASSSDEIATGLEKFASVAKTTGLSFDYAAAALATITATTRQSADTVGTALKTIFSRLQSLKLGETLDDNTDLTKYSGALEAIGVNIKNASGGLKDLDVILDETGQKWQSLTRDQKMATAQTVAGIRQYNQFIALMDNWDFFQENLSTERNSSGELQKQADIYAESWEAAGKRVKASAEAIYDALLDDKFFIAMTNGLATFLDKVRDLIDAFGGLPGVLTIIGTLLTKVFNQQIFNGFMGMFSGITRKESEALKQEAQAEAFKTAQFQDSKMGINQSDETRVEVSHVDVSNDENKLTEMLKEKKQYLTEQDAQILQAAVDYTKELGQQVLLTEKLAHEKQDAAKSVGQDLIDQAKKNAEENKPQQVIDAKTGKSQSDTYPNGKPVTVHNEQVEQVQNTVSNLTAQVAETEKAKVAAIALNDAFTKVGAAGGKISAGTKKALQILQKTGKLTTEEIEQLQTALESGIEPSEDLAKKLQEITTLDFSDFDASFNQLKEQLLAAGFTGEEADQAIENFKQSLIESSGAAGQAATDLITYADGVEHVTGVIQRTQTASGQLAQGLTSLSSVLMQVGMAITAIHNLGNIWSNDDLSIGEKLFQSLTSISMILPVVTTLMNAENRKRIVGIGLSLKEIAARKLSSLVEGSSVVVKKILSAANIELGVSEQFALWPLLLLTAAFIAAVAAITLITLGVKAFNESLNQEANDAKAAAEAAENLTEAYNNTKAAYQELQDTLKNHEDAVASLNELTIGSREWKDQLREANEIALQLLHNYPELVNAMNKDPITGLITFDKKEVEKIKEEQSKKVDEMYAVSAMANADASKAQNKATAHDLGKQMYGESPEAIGAASAALGTTLGAAIGTAILPGVGSAIGAALGGLSGYFAGATAADSAIDANSDTIMNIAQSLADAEADIIGMSDAEIASKYGISVDLVPAIRDLAGSISAASLEFSSAAQAAASAILQGEKSFQDNSHQEEIAGAGGQFYEKEYNELKEKYLSQATNRDEVFGSMGTETSKNFVDGILRDQDFISSHAQLSKADANSIKVSNYLADGNVKVSYTSDGDKKTAVLSAEEMAAFQAAKEAAEHLTANVDVLADTFNQLYSEAKTSGGKKSETEQSTDQVFADFLDNGNLDNSSIGQISALLDQLSDNAISATFQLEDIINSTFSQEQLEAFGYETASEMAKALYGGLKSSEKQLNDVGTYLGNNISTSVQETFAKSFDMGAFKDLSSQEISSLTKMYQQAFANSGKDGLKTINKLILSAGDKSEEVAHVLQNTDWGTVKLEELREQLKNAGAAIDHVSDVQLENLKRSMQNFDVSPDEAKQNYTKLQEFSDLDYGDTIKAEDFSSMTAISSELGIFFTELADGTYELTGDVNEFAEALSRIGVGEMTAALSELEGQVNTTTQALSIDYASLTDSRATSTYADEGLAYLQSTGFGDNEEGAAKLAEWSSDLAKYWPEIAAAVKETGDKTDDLNKKLQEQQEKVEKFKETLQETQKLNELKKLNLDPKEIKNYADELKESGKYTQVNDAQLKEMAKDQLRYDRAVTSANKNLSKWNTDLKTAAKTGHLNSETLNEMQDAYGDLLDIDGSMLSKDFIKNADNLHLMEEAINGNDEAYQQLMEKARQDIATNIGLNDAEFQAKFSDLMSKYYEGQSLDDIEVGASLDDEGFLQGLSDMVNAAGMTKEQATAYLSAMGVDAEIEEVPAETTPVITQNSYWQPATYTSGSVASGQNGEGSFSYPKLETAGSWVPVTSTTEQQATPNAFSLKVTSANKSSGGNTKFTGSNAARGSGSGGKGGGGGNSGGGKTQKPKTKNKDEERERYYTVNKQIDALKASYDKVSASRERAYGAKHLEGLKKEIELTSDHIDLLERKRKENELYIISDQKALRESLKGVATPQFDENNILINYDEVHNAVYDEYNRRMEAAVGDSDKESEVEEWLKKITDALSNWEESNQIKLEIDEALLEEQRKFLDKQFEGIEYTITIKVDALDFGLDYIEYQLERVEDIALRSFEDINRQINTEQKYQNNKMLLNSKKLAAAKKGIDESLNVQIYDTDEEGNILKDEAGNKKVKFALTDEQKAKFLSGDTSFLQELEGIKEAQPILEALTNYSNQQLEALQGILEAEREIAAAPQKEFETLMENIDKVIERYDDLKNLQIGLLDYVDVVGSRMTKVMTDQVRNMKQEAFETQRVAARSLYVQKAMIEEMMNTDIADRKSAKTRLKRVTEEREAALKKATTADEIRQVQEAYDIELKAAQDYYDALEDKFYEVANSLNDALTQAAEDAKDAYLTTFENMMRDWESAISDSYNTLEDLQNAFAQKKTLSEQFIPEYQQVYELNKMNRDILKQIDMTDNVTAQRKLRDFQQEIIDLQNSGKKLSEYDLQYLQKKYDLRVAEIALEDAQNAKNQVRLSRDAEGNYSYVYTADEDKTSAAASNYEEKLYQAQDLTEKYLTTAGEQYIQTLIEMQQALAGMKEQDFANAEEFAQKQKEIEDYYLQRLTYFSGQQENALNNNKDLYNNDYLAYQSKLNSMSGANQSFLMDQNSFATEFNQTLTGQVFTSYDSLRDHLTNVTITLDAQNVGLTDSLKGLYEQYYANVTGMLEDVGVYVANDYPGQTLTGTDKIRGYLGISEEDYDKYKNAVVEKLQTIEGEMTTYAGRVKSTFSNDSDSAWSESKGGLADFIAELGGEEGLAKKLDAVDGGIDAVVDALMEGELGQKMRDAGIDAGVLKAALGGDKGVVKLLEDAGINVGTLVKAFNGTEFGGKSLTTILEENETDVEGLAKKFIGENGADGLNSALDTGATKMRDVNQAAGDASTTLETKFGGTALDDINNKVGTNITTPFSEASTAVDGLNTAFENYTGVNVGDILHMPDDQEIQTKMGPVLQSLENTLKTTELSVDVAVNYDIEIQKLIDATQAALSEIDNNIDNRPIGFAGDLNDDGVVNSTDVRILMRALNPDIDETLTPEQFKKADVNGDGIVDVSDLAKIHLIAAKLTPTDAAVQQQISDYKTYTEFKNSILKRFDTGGYTGDWSNNNGKLAVLHEKELVLNATDTSNILDVVSIVRDLAASIDLQSKSAQYALNSILSPGSVKSIASENNNEQNITIYADFPNVSVAAEIQSAFDQMELQASQYAYQSV